MNDLLRELAPLSDEAWKAIDDEARKHLQVTLAGRRIVDFTGPLGYEAAAVGTGYVDPLSAPPAEGVSATLRKVQRLVELRAPFVLRRSEIESIARGAKAPDLDEVRRAARTLSSAEDRAIFHGFAEADIAGIFECSKPNSLTLTRDYQKYPLVVSEALARLFRNGVGGPYAIALGPDCYAGLTGTATTGGYPVLQHVQRLIDGPVVWAPSIKGALVASLRGGDFELIVGRDVSIGYQSHSQSEVQLYLEETMTFRVLSPEAAVPLVYHD